LASNAARAQAEQTWAAGTAGRQLCTRAEGSAMCSASSVLQHQVLKASRNRPNSALCSFELFQQISISAFG